jgi:integration host factor subunit beta
MGWSMNKIELINALKNEGMISKKEAATIVDLFFDKISSALSEGDRVEIRGLCTFFVKEYESYNGRNPRTGETVNVGPKKVAVF